MMLGPYYENVILPDNIFDLLKAYYHDVYGSQQQINPTIVQFGRLRLGSDIYGATISPRYENRSFIQAKFLGQTDNTVDIYPGKVQFFFQHVAMVNNRPKTHHLAYVRWYQPHKTKRFDFALQNEQQLCAAEIWSQTFYPMRRDCIIPVQMILSRFIPYSMNLMSRNNRQYNVLVVIPINKRFHI